MIKKINRNHGVLVYQQDLMTEHRKNYVIRDINYFVKMTATLSNFVYALAQTQILVGIQKISILVLDPLIDLYEFSHMHFILPSTLEDS